MSFLTPSPADEARRSALRRMRLIATGLLVLAAVIFVATLPFEDASVLGYVNTAAEAAMVGALADWFAVTAIFRHPLGLPIPHTALVKKRKDEIGRNLEEFVDDNFLTEEIARDRLAHAQIGMRLGIWLDDAEHRRVALREMARVARVGLQRIDEKEVRTFLTDVVLPRLAEEPASPIVGDFLAGIVEDKAHRGLIDIGVMELHDWLAQNPDAFVAVLEERAPTWTPKWVDDRVITWTYQQALGWLEAIHDDPEHPAKNAIDDLLRTLASDLQQDPTVMERAEALKERVLTHPQVGETAESLWVSISASLLRSIDDPSSLAWQRGDGWLAELSEKLRTDEEFRGGLESRLGDVVAFFVNTYGAELAQVISHTVERWDVDEASERIELFVGRDLQFIRINGTIVGALAGLLIHTLAQLVLQLT